MTIQARYPGTCPECGGRWQPGDPIDTVEPGSLSKWKHAVCPQHGQDGVEALARVLRAAAGDDEHRMILNMSNTRSGRQARNLLADPGPLLAALAEAGVLEDRAGAWDGGFDAGHQSARAVNPEWPTMPGNPYREVQP